MRLTAAALAALALAAPAASQDIPIALQPGEMLLQVQADGEAKARPDVMEIEAGVTTTAASARAALTANNAQSQRLIDSLRAQGIAATDVQTSNLSVQPQTDEDQAERQGREPKIIGYVASNQLRLRLRDLGRAADVIDALFDAGANTVSGPKFSMSDPKPAQRQARIAAVAAAREEAETYAGALGMRIVRVLRSSERGDFSSAQDEGFIVVTGSRIRRPNIEPGEVTNKITVWIDYAMVPR